MLQWVYHKTLNITFHNKLYNHKNKSEHKNDVVFNSKKFLRTFEF